MKGSRTATPSRSRTATMRPLECQSQTRPADAAVGFCCLGAALMAAAAFPLRDPGGELGEALSESGPYRLETPWRVVEKSDCFVIEDASGVALAHIAFVPAGGPHRAPGQMSRSEALTVANRMLAAQDRKIAIRRAAERIEAAERELQETSRKLH